VLNSTANGQLQSQHEYKQQQYNTGQNKQKTTKQRKMDQLRLFKVKHDLLKISADL
jgi:hypothetical protein